MPKLLRLGDTYTVYPESITILDHLRTGIIRVRPSMAGLEVTEISTEPYKVPEKIYGDLEAKVVKIFRKWKSRGYRNTTVHFNGLKGAGKSLLAKLACNHGMDESVPVFVIDNASAVKPAVDWVRKAGVRAIFFIDEFEKVFSSESDQQGLLSFLDGTVETEILIVITTNTMFSFDDNLVHRPGRILYRYDYDSLPKEVVKQILEDTLKKKSSVRATLKEVNKVPKLSFDVLNEIIHEMNEFDVTAVEALKELNIISHVRPDRRHQERIEFENLPNQVGKSLDIGALMAMMSGNRNGNRPQEKEPDYLEVDYDGLVEYVLDKVYKDEEDMSDDEKEALANVNVRRMIKQIKDEKLDGIIIPTGEKIEIAKDGEEEVYRISKPEADKGKGTSHNHSEKGCDCLVCKVVYLLDHDRKDEALPILNAINAIRSEVPMQTLDRVTTAIEAYFKRNGRSPIGHCGCH